MAYTQDQLNALTEAIALGATFVKYSDKEVSYRSLAEMRLLKKEMEQDLGLSRPTSRKRIGVYTKGLTITGRRRCTPRAATSAGTSSATTPAADYTAITLFIVTVPDDAITTDAGGTLIYTQYAPGATLTPLIYTPGTARADSTPLLAGKKVLWPFTMNDQARQLMGYNTASGTADNTTYGGAGFGNGDYITINFK